ncbi:MAG: hypothetical protein M3R25_12370 [Bacteroidota bacterium]|nr:hypothetical protein [Bacteroidota bacterium]
MEKQADELSLKISGLKMVVSGYLEEIASEADREKGADLADILERFDWRDFRVIKKPTEQKSIEVAQNHQTVYARPMPAPTKQEWVVEKW